MTGVPDFSAISQYLEDVSAGKVDELQEPGKWPIKNALMCIREDIGRILPAEDEYHKGVQLALRYAVEVIKGINGMKQPEPPDPVEAEKRAQRELYRAKADAYESYANMLRDIADGEIPDGWDIYAHNWRE